MSLIGLSFFLIPQFYLAWFKNEENVVLWNQVSKMTADLLKIVAIFTALDSIYLNVSFALKGAGDTRFVSAIALLIPWPVFVLPAYLMRGFQEAVFWAWVSVAFYSLLVATILIIRFRGGKWKSMSVISSS